MTPLILATAALQCLPQPEMVCGWQPESRNVTGYWWWHEDNTDGRGCAIEHGDALYWTEIVLPEFPQPPATEIAK